MRGLLAELERALSALETAAPGPKKERWCPGCGGRHKGRCKFVATSYGTRCRPDLLDTLEARAAERRAS